MTAENQTADAPIPHNIQALLNALNGEESRETQMKLASILRGGERPIVFSLNAKKLARFRAAARRNGLAYASVGERDAQGAAVLCRASAAETVKDMLEKIGCSEVVVQCYIPQTEEDNRPNVRRAARQPPSSKLRGSISSRRNTKMISSLAY